jgi:hypothetical protein
MIPLIGGVNELADQAQIVRRVADEVLVKAGARYAIYHGKSVYILSDRKEPAGR